MAIANPVFISLMAAQDATVTVTLSTPENVADWTVTATVRSYNGQTALITKTLSSGISIAAEGTGSWTITYSAANLTLTPGSYVFEFQRTNVGFVYPICDPSPFVIRSAAATTTPTLTNMGEYLAWKGETLSIGDESAWQIILGLGAAEAAIRRRCGRQFTFASYTEYVNGSGQPYFCVKEPPITSITSVYEDLYGYFGQASDAFPSTSLLTSGTDYYYAIDSPDGLGHAGKVHRIGTTWPGRYRRPPEGLGFQRESLPGCIKITYAGGYSLVPFDLKRAVWQVATQAMNEVEFGLPLTSESFEDYSYSLMSVADEMARTSSIERTIGQFIHGRMLIA